MERSDGRRLDHSVLESYRFAAVKLQKAGVHVDIIVKSFGVSRQAVYRWVRCYYAEGKNGLRSTTASGREPQLTERQQVILGRLLRQPATELGYLTDLWSGPRIRHLIKHRFGLEYHPKHMPRLLKRMGLELKFPERRALEQDPKAVRAWKRKRLPEIIDYAKKKCSLVFYADESLISLIPYVGRTWSFPKSKPIAYVSGKRGQHVGVTAAVNRQGRLCFELTREKERFTARIFIRFIKKMRKENPSRSMVLIVDGAPTHKAKVVKAFTEENKSWLRLEILPAYSPELNPTEKSWRFVKTKKLNASTVRDKVELRNETRRVMKETKKDKKRVISFFEDL